MKIAVVQGDLLDQPVEVIVNAWNRNIIPWWLLLPQGVSGAIKKRGGIQPFREVARHGPIPLGQAVLTSAGRLPFRGIIHVAGINLLWRASEYSIRQSARTPHGTSSSNRALLRLHFRSSVQAPAVSLKTKALEIILDELQQIRSSARVVVVEYRR